MTIQPSVFAVGDTYQILVPSPKPTLMWVKVGDCIFYDDSNGIMRSKTKMHRMTLPQKLLDEAKEYTIGYRSIPHRKPYCSKPSEPVEEVFSFQPVPNGSVRAYHIADAHNRIEEPVRAAQTFGDFDFLIFNGDMPDNSGDPKNFFGIFEIAFTLTGGHKPIVFARGNHDLRGVYAEKYAEYTPQDNGNVYYSFRLGSIWGVVLDCGEDKNDDHVEYGHTVCCHDFRQRETAYLQKMIREKEYEAEGIDRRLVICHNPFTFRSEPPFDIEPETYSEWGKLLREHIRPDLMICGHLHTMEVMLPGDKSDHLGHPCPILVASKPGKGYFAGGGIVFDSDKAEVTFTDSDGKVLGTQTIYYPKGE